MARAFYVKKARKDNPAVKKGEPYWYCDFRYGGRRYFASQPRASQLTQSSFFGQVYSLQEDLEDANPTTLEELEDLLEDARSRAEDIYNEVEEALENIPEQLQETHMLMERKDEVYEWQSEFDSFDLTIDVEEFDEDEIDRDDFETDEEYNEEMDEARSEREIEIQRAIDEKMEELRGIEYQGS